eukprot:TRINITY_DN82859_c0_g1_i1.p1 TRINITY_DN82859_c0_g1~~TRINITY_DN82859_c0_g1_i1.p1  ORF type:complete len:575 (-),score=132.19 TRINITY_DN82859_c0_g1_i1:63-1787(-)
MQQRPEVSTPSCSQAEALVIYDDGSSASKARAGSSDVTDLLLRYAKPDVAAGVAIFGLKVGAVPILSQCSQTSDRLLSVEEEAVRLGALGPEAVTSELQADWSEISDLCRSGAVVLADEVQQLQRWRDQVSESVASLERRSALAFLGLPANAEPEAVHRSYKQKALSVHPDKGGSEEEFQELQSMLDRIQVESSEDDIKNGGGGGLFGMNELLKRCKESQKNKEANDDEDDLPEATKLQRRRLMLHDQALDLSKRAMKALEQLQVQNHPADQLSQSTAAGGQPPVLDLLRSFVKGFAIEVTAMTPFIAAAERVFCKFVRQGVEVLTGAALADAQGTVALVALEFTGPLLRVARRAGPCPRLDQRCQGLLRSLAAVPSAFENALTALREGLANRRAAEWRGCDESTGVPKPCDDRTGVSEPSSPAGHKAAQGRPCPFAAAVAAAAAAESEATGSPEPAAQPVKRVADAIERRPECSQAGVLRKRSARPEEAYQETSEWRKLRAFCIRTRLCVNYNRDANDLRCTLSAGECNFRHVCAACGAEEKGGPKAQYQNHGGWNCLKLQAWLMAHGSVASE